MGTTSLRDELPTHPIRPGCSSGRLLANRHLSSLRETLFSSPGPSSLRTDWPPAQLPHGAPTSIPSSGSSPPWTEKQQTTARSLRGSGAGACLPPLFRFLHLSRFLLSPGLCTGSSPYLETSAHLSPSYPSGLLLPAGSLPCPSQPWPRATAPTLQLPRPAPLTLARSCLDPSLGLPSCKLHEGIACSPEPSTGLMPSRRLINI